MLDVGFDTLKQRELHRRNRRMAVVTALALVVMLVTTALAITAVIARHDAERRQKQAEELVGFMLGDLNDKLQEVSRLDIMEAVDDKAMGYFASLPTTDVTDEALKQRAKALEKIGSIRFAQGHLPAAMESYRAALKLSGRLADAAPNDADRQIAYSRDWAWVGYTDWYEGNLDAAQQSFESAQTVVQRAVSHSADDPELIYQLTAIENNIGHVLEARGKLDEAEALYRQMLVHCKQLVAGRAAKAVWTAQLGSAHNNLGKVALTSGDLATAIAEYSADDAIESDLSAKDPKNNDQLYNTFTVRAILGRTLALTGDIETGVRDLQQAIDIATQLIAVDPTQTGVQENLALYQMQLSRLLRLAGQLPKANALTAQALQAFARLTKQDPANADWQREFAEVQTEHAAQTFAGDDKNETRKQAQAALDMLAPLLAKQPDDRAILLATVNAKLLLASVTDDAQAVQQVRQDALSAIKAVKSGTSDPRLLALQIEALLGLDKKPEAQPLIQRLWESGYRDLALVAVLQREHIDYPINEAFQQKLQAATAKKDS
ncbi:MAG TPA: hypothetical protein VIE67_09775 [Rudaea sp.]|uniref:hypothetical protein n=1 Tax=Rudaea sp. TaxID=2136325 RepID=UPI002F94D868